MKNNKPHFWYNKSQRNGVLFLGIIIIILQLFYVFFDFSSDKIIDLNSAKISKFQSEIDSLKLIEIEKRKPKIYPFNPSFITDYKGYKLGMNITEINKLLNFRKKGNYINSAKQFQQVTGINDSLLNILKPKFKFPDWVTNKKSKKAISNKHSNMFSGEKIDLNLATKEDLKSINGIGEKLSERILKFKTSIGGYKSEEQLQKVYGLKPEVVTRILIQFFIKKSAIISQPKIVKDINKASAIELKSINGIGEKLSARIVKFRDNIGGFYFKDQLNEVYGLKPEVIEKLFKEFKILSKPTITKININEATFKEVLHLPYIDYELTKKIFNYRDEFAEIETIDELKKIEGFPLEKYDRIILYLKAE
ncbi:MAG: helix-hairpin-helix domain-containing protein [Flavobacteriaceae bacterium]